MLPNTLNNSFLTSLQVKMERQRSFSLKPIRLLVFYFSSFFLVFFFICVFKAIPLSLTRTQTHTIIFNTSSVVYVQSLRGFNTTFVEKDSIFNGTLLREDGDFSDFQELGHVISNSDSEKNSILNGTLLRGDEVSLEVGNLSLGSFVKVSNLGNEKNSILNGTLLEEDEVSLKVGNLSMGSFGKVSNLDGLQELGHVISNSGSVNSSLISNGGENSSIRSNVEEKGSKVICDITKGRWVFDESYPLYTNVECPFIDEGFNCEGNGRLDKDYMKWRWQPQDCDIPRFNASNMLELIRGKRLVFVGDSLNRNQWESMLCMLMRGVKDPKKVYETRGRKITKSKGNYCFKFEEYKCTVEYYVTHFLVHESKARVGRKRVETLRIDTIDKGSSRWKGADILVFNTAHWWSHHKTKAGINYYQEGDQVHPQLDVSKAFKRALSTWASWVDKYINPHKTHIFFRSSAPSHFSGGLWNSGGHCKEAFQPINKTFMSEYPEKNLIVEETISQMKNQVTFLNITSLSDYRPDGHPSIYGSKSVNRRRGVEDCSHWCLPGVPDNWNELLYYNLQLRTNNKRLNW